jgi:hypothetical protein
MIVSLLTAARDESKLTGLVYASTLKTVEEPLAWYAKPGSPAIPVVSGTLFLNLIFW